MSQSEICPSTCAFCPEGCSAPLGENGSDDFRIVEVAGSNPVTSTANILAADFERPEQCHPVTPSLIESVTQRDSLSVAHP